ncbi:MULTISPECIES: hypothetical protein [Chryseobacterium]|uniref:Uncharacterized protein n=1 Tax=Chryseobacterium gambrini TaxID=373672 RepID=A0A1N7LGP2_9FLAO|nr:MULTISPECIES: hypothetical protein [Chryseobacterium]SIS72964.1 hypothetical protein SAMN05421785_102222 [Chryseobacterium gambrini]
MTTSDQKILEFVQILKNLNEIRFDRDFYTPIGMTKFVFSNIKNQDKYPDRQSWHFTAEHIRLICEVFNADSNFFFGLADQPFRKLKKKGNINGNIKLNKIIDN